MKKIVPEQSLIKFYIATLVILTLLSYLMVLFNLNIQGKKKSEEVFNDIYHKLNSHLKSNQFNLNEILSNHTDHTTISYKVMVTTPSGQIFIHSNRRKDQEEIPFFTLPYWGHGKNVRLYHEINSHELLGWGALTNGYEVYLQIVHPPVKIDWSKPFYWLPIIVALLLFIVGMYHTLRYNTAWRHLIEYTNTFPVRLNEPYQPLRNREIRVGRDFQRLTNSLNRINQQFHQTHRLKRALAKRLRRLTDFSPLPMLIIYRNGQIGYFNRRFEQSFMTGFQEEITYYVTDFLTGKDKRTQLILTKLGDLRISRTLSVTGLENNVDYLLHLQPWIGEQGQIQGFVALLTDISTLTSELKDIDIKIQQQADKLVAFDKLWSVLGHELRTPLSGIIGLLELMDTNNFNHDQLETYQSLEKTSQNMISMLNDMLDVAKMDAGKLQIIVERTDLLALCRQVAGLMSSNARRQNIELLLFFDPHCPRYLDTDSGRIRQALMNLLGNAIKFTKTGYVALQVECLKSLDPDFIAMSSESSYTALSNHAAEWICFRVKDTGIGIGQDDIAKLFSHFGQANESISRQFGGTGLGLAISNNFAQLLGGFIHVNSVLGVGSEFILCLPSNQKFHQPAYQFNADLSSISLIAFNSLSISTAALNKVANYLGLACMAYTGVNEEDINKISRINFGQLTVIILIENELYTTDDVALIHELPIAKHAPKILLSMQPKSTIPAERKKQYDSFLTKPLTISQLIRELLHLSNTEKVNQGINQSSSSRVQSSFEAFMIQFEKEEAQADNHLTDASSASNMSPDNQLLSLKGSNNDGVSPLVLVAEDNAINQKVACKILEKLGYRTVVADNGQQALKILEQNEHDISLILMDCRMPVMSGLEATRHIRSNHSSLPIIALTANDTDADREECIEAGMNGFLSKPIKKEALLSVLNKFMVS